MTENSTARVWIMRGIFAVLAVLILFLHLLPLDTTPRGWAGPDVLLALACAWCVRRPEYVPTLLLAAVFLLYDFLLQRPPGLWAVLALLGCENLKTRGRSLRDANFIAEWATVGLILIGVTLAYRIVLALVLVDVPPLALSLSGLGMTLLCYPLVVAATHWGMGVRKATPGDLDAMGQRT